jgi:hypothetical protein
LPKPSIPLGLEPAHVKNAIIIQNILFLVASGIAVLAYGHPRPALALGA